MSVNYALTIGLRFNYIGQELGGSGGEKEGGEGRGGEDVRLLGNGRVLKLVSLSSVVAIVSLGGGISAMLTIDRLSILIR